VVPAVVLMLLHALRPFRRRRLARLVLLLTIPSQDRNEMVRAAAGRSF
jgi:hypothetical protein